MKQSTPTEKPVKTRKDGSARNPSNRTSGPKWEVKASPETHESTSPLPAVRDEPQPTSNHTPGPWETYARTVRTCAGKRTLAFVSIGDVVSDYPAKTIEANARLIAAAPSMYNDRLRTREILTNIIEGCTFAGDPHKCLEEIRHWCEAFILTLPLYNVETGMSSGPASQVQEPNEVQTDCGISKESHAALLRSNGELLEACKALIDYMEYLIVEYVEPAQGDSGPDPECVSNARAAIGKAELIMEENK